MKPKLIDTWTSVNGVRMFARVSQNSAHSPLGRIVLVHGLGVSSRYMIPLALELAEYYQVCAPDLPGFGRSEKPRMALTVPELAQFLADWMRCSGFECSIFVGNSMGCQIIVEYAAANVKAAKAAVFLAPAIDPSAGGLVPNIGRLMVDVFREPVSLIAIAALDYLCCGPFRLIKTFKHSLKYPMLFRSKQVDAETLILRGARDPIVSEAWAKQVASSLPHTRLLQVPGAGHALNYNSPETVAGLIVSFLRQIGG